MTIHVIKHSAEFSYDNYLLINDTVKYFEDHILELSEDGVCQSLHSEVFILVKHSKKSTGYLLLSYFYGC